MTNEKPKRNAHKKLNTVTGEQKKMLKGKGKTTTTKIVRKRKKADESISETLEAPLKKKTKISSPENGKGNKIKKVQKLEIQKGKNSTTPKGTTKTKLLNSTPAKRTPTAKSSKSDKKKTPGVANKAVFKLGKSPKSSTPKGQIKMNTPKGRIKMNTPDTKKSKIKVEKTPKDSKLATQKNKGCKKNGCSVSVLKCFAKAKCDGSEVSCRWNHISTGEHFCNDCHDYFYRSNKEGSKEFDKWKKIWSANGKTEANLRVFMTDRYLPYWIQCTDQKCKKWRELSSQLNITPDFVRKFRCGMDIHGVKSEVKYSCQQPEDQRVSEAKDYTWIVGLTLPPHLQKSVVSPLLRNYYPDCVGLSAFTHTYQKQVSNGKSDGRDSDSSSGVESEDDENDEYLSHIMGQNGFEIKPARVPGMSPYVQPFLDPEEPEKAYCFHPEYMTEEEEKQFPEFSGVPFMYLAIRNLVLGLWALEPKVCLTVERCMANLLCRGLVRIRSVQEMERIVNYFSRQGIINGGVLEKLPKGGILPPEYNKEKVIVIGAGPSGLAAAMQLQKFGTQVTVLEARDRIGGRVMDDHSFGLCVGRGAQIVNGFINNPITLICEQKNHSMRTLTDKCDLINEEGKVTCPETDRKIDFHFNAMLDNVAEWRKHKKSSPDIGLLEKIHDMHKQFIEESQLSFSEEEERLLQFHVSNLEYACGSDLGKVSAHNWDQNEIFPQIGGVHTWMTNGYSCVLDELAKGLTIEKNQEVSKIDYTSNNVKVTTKSGQVFQGSKVLVTLPVKLLQKDVVKFNPPLPKQKITAINSLGTGIIEKVALQFPNKFWAKKVQGADFFGHVPTTASNRGQFGVFYDLTAKENKKEKSICTLMTYLSGDSVKLIHENTDKEIIDICMETLRKLFPEENVPDPLHTFVTRWSEDPFSQMSYSYIAVGCTGEAYDDMAKEVDGKIYFAGEGTNRQFPQTVNGAYLSGVREAAKIAFSSFESSLNGKKS